MVEVEADVEVIAGGPDIGTEERRASPTRNTRGGTLRGKRAGKGSSTGRRGEEGAADIGKQRRGRGVVQAGQRPKRGAGQGPRHLREGGGGGGQRATGHGPRKPAATRCSSNRSSRRRRGKGSSRRSGSSRGRRMVEVEVEVKAEEAEVGVEEVESSSRGSEKSSNGRGGSRRRSNSRRAL